jgi:AcrR family transcriptional regulator
VTTPNASRTARAIARDELTTAIKTAARGQLAEVGAAGLSLRAVAREIGMVSSAVYRYFATRDDLLTALIIDAYDAVGAVAEHAEAAVTRGDLLERWLAVSRAVRQWAVAHPQEWALIFGSPVPGFRAPQDTVDPAARIPLLLIAILRDAPASPADRAEPREPLPEAVRVDMAGLAALVAPELPPELLAQAVAAWTMLVGTINFELFGHLVGSVTDYAAYFEHQMTVLAGQLGLRLSAADAPSSAGTSRRRRSPRSARG